MKKVLVIFLLAACGLATNAERVKSDSFENGVPKHWQLVGKGKLSISPWHYKDGKQSLQWDFEPGDVIKIVNTLGDITQRGGFSNVAWRAFGVWVYMEHPLKNKALRFEFRENKNKRSEFEFALNYCGWQSAFAHYRGWDRKVLSKTIASGKKINNILIKAPTDCSGRVYIDLVVYNGLLDYRFEYTPLKTPWLAPRLDEKKIPLPEKLSQADIKAIEQLKKSLMNTPKTAKNVRVKEFQKIIKELKSYNIVEDAHGIRGKSIQLPSLIGIAHHSDIFYTANGIKADSLHSMNEIVNSHFLFQKIILFLKRGASKVQFDSLAPLVANLCKHILDQGFNNSIGLPNNYVYHKRKLFDIAYLFRDELRKQKIMEQLSQTMQYSDFALFSPVSKETSMDYFQGARNYYLQALTDFSGPRKQVQAFRYIANKLSTEICADNGPNGFKPDGSAYHSTENGGRYTLYTLVSLATVCRAISGSSFALNDSAYNRLKKSALVFYFCSNNLERSLKNQAAHPTYMVKLHRLPGILKNLALGRPDGKLDRELAQAYVNLRSSPVIRRYDNIFEKKYGIKPSAPPQGNLSMPYAYRMAHRRKDYLAVADAGRNDIRQGWNRFGRYISVGLLEIIGKDGFIASGNVYNAPGFDWNRIDGTTVIHYPLVKLRPKEKGNPIQTLRHKFKGGTSWRGINGCFTAQLGRNKKCISFDQSFDGKKSYFFINDRIYAVGSDIECTDSKHKVQTNLYQKALFTNTDPGEWSYRKKTAPEIKTIRRLDAPTFVDGKEIKAFPVNNSALATKASHYLLDTVGNGYYVAKGQKVHYARKRQKSRHATDGILIAGRKLCIGDTEGEYATAWIDHGIAPKDGKYNYVVLPYCGEKKLAEFAKTADAGKVYKILQQDAKAHIVHDLIDGFYAGIFFKGSSVKNLPYVKNIERACQIMYKEKNGKLEVAVGDPDPHRKPSKEFRAGAHGGRSNLTPLKVSFAGSWKLAEPTDGVKIVSTNKDQTVIEFACIHGKDFNFTLLKKIKD